MVSRLVSTPVSVPEKFREGTYANAFHLHRGEGSEWFMDFLVYKEETRKATVVVRVRVDEPMLSAIRDRLDETLRAGASPPMTMLAFEANGEVH